MHLPNLLSPLGSANGTMNHSIRRILLLTSAVAAASLVVVVGRIAYNNFDTDDSPSLSSSSSSFEEDNHNLPPWRRNLRSVLHSFKDPHTRTKRPRYKRRYKRINRGPWSNAEHAKFLKGVEWTGWDPNADGDRGGHAWEISKLIPTRSVNDVKLHAKEFLKLQFTHGGRTFELPTDTDWIVNYRGWKEPRHKVSYARDEKEILARGSQGKCAGALVVLDWIMDKVHEVNGMLMLAYGDLIHIHREKDFVDKETGQYIDDDIDSMVNLETFSYIAGLERELFLNFGWSIRIHQLDDKYALQGQIFATCGHVITHKRSKATSVEPTIEIYPIVTIPTNDPIIELYRGSVIQNPQRHTYRIVRDIWQGTLFPEEMMFPPQHFALDSSTGLELDLQIPAQALTVMDCLYGEWRVPSSRRAGTRNCVEWSLANS
mmetsp:Transcript_6565/g.14545  ORF Transcript_6565/g.14545 Transcript_6565/m.14545 type:complete len:430 (+) Transcript_6565:741-2030(+)